MFAFATRVVGFSLLAASISLGDEPDGARRPALLAGTETEFAHRMFQITEMVLDKHVEPPTRQEMLLSGLTAIHGDLAPEGLSRIVSSVAKEDEFADCLIGFWPDKNPAFADQALRQAFLEGMGQVVPGGLGFISSKEATVERQLAANQYVGIGIALAYENNSYRIGATFPRGPAAKAGITSGEFILEVDGVKTEGLPVTDIIDRLRGPEGTTVAVRVTRGAESESRLVTLIRSLVPRQTVVGHRQTGPETWESVINGKVPIAYLNIQEIGGSTVSELREYEAELTAKGVKLLVLDLRGKGGAELRYALTLADALVDTSRAGSIRSRDRSVPVTLDPDCLFRDWRLAVLVDESTHGYAEWVAGLLQSRRGAIVVGRPTSGSWRLVFTAVELPENWGVMRLATAVLERDEDARAFKPAGNAFAPWTRSLLFQTTASSDLRSVTPNVEVESSPQQGEFAGGKRPDVRHSRIVVSAIEALRGPMPPEAESPVETEP